MSNQTESLLSKDVTGQKQDIDMEAMTTASYKPARKQPSPWAACLGMGLTLALVMAVITAPTDSKAPEQACCNNLLLEASAKRTNHLVRLEWEYFLLENLVPEMSEEYKRDMAEAEKPLSAGEAFSLETHMSRRLPKYKNLFRTVAGEHAIDWHLVAAISYQESHWHPKAKSPTGVRGMMMLTLPTAKEMGIRNRLDAEQSVRGGVRYLQQLRHRLPETIVGADRTWMALAAYNVGIGHLYDARDLARRHGLNPNAWNDVRNCLLMLENPLWHKQARYGYANGSEPVRYVDNIKRYYRHILAAQSENDRHIVASNGNGHPVL
ncbi:transglycosylase SLT domain-containing protein [Sansalvadorimonas sp. 2012CJ34-2]|uniref:Transglycosylase SLT domain-containing protein n=1 Tax=Parendozoicomonas callyspongiae TaxID=2942213 RepID=A0ABT0PDZ4_9GAMM|nr:transglycosylase SLT domain-containing protein [Sansalvadorimonas sp. 2012CJ34-2]MCL6269598.1 transglycosylase SLT domain-containing protein [Sansalvadorimonas sp. 2012CJ34-2]